MAVRREASESIQSHSLTWGKAVGGGRGRVWVGNRINNLLRNHPKIKQNMIASVALTKKKGILDVIKM